jgi:threonine/homoserine/homoserine lactone efflux protein
MEFQIWLYYLLAILVLTATPGPSTLMCLSKSVSYGFRASVFSALGSLTAILIILTLSFTSLGIIIASSELIFNIVKYIGAIYLIYLGYKAFTSKEDSYILNKDLRNSKVSYRSSYISGFIVGASNPKAIIFFTALFPQFINTNESLLTQYIIFASTFAILELSFLLIYAYLGVKSSNWLSQKGRAKIFNKLTGSVFIGAGLFLSSTNRS